MQYKTCTKCNQVLPATFDYFRKQKNGKFGVASWCITCHREYNRVRAEEKRRALGRQEIRNREIIDGKIQCFRCKAWKPATSEYFRKQSKTKIPFRGVCKDCYAKERADKRDEVNATKRKQYRTNPEAAKAARRRAREWQRENYEYRRRYMQDYLPEYRQKPGVIEKHRTHLLNYRARKKRLPHSFTPDDRAQALDYFNGCCAVCERQLNDLFGEHTAAMDHWIPLSADNCPGTVVANIIPLCHGVGGCNNSKADREPNEWLGWKFGKRKAKHIAARIEAYFQWVVNQRE